MCEIEYDFRNAEITFNFQTVEIPNRVFGIKRCTVEQFNPAFGVPSDNHIQDLLDGVKPESVFAVFLDLSPNTS